MGRRGLSLYGVARTMARAAREADAAQRRAEREALRRQRAHEIEIKRLNRAEKHYYQESRILETESLNFDIKLKIEELKDILEHTLNIDDSISFDSLRPKEKPHLIIPASLEKTILPPSLESFTSTLKKPSFFQRLLPGWKARHNLRLEELKIAHRAEVEDSQKQEKNRLASLAKLDAQHKTDLKIYEQKNSEIDHFSAAYFEGDVLAVETYNSMVLERSDYPDEFPQSFKLAYLPDSNSLLKNPASLTGP